ncbi:hypothetical protein ASD12_32555 [Mesorhizobium sp. Root102]|uniref:hypothetical protein n=1 Tax=Mesorhizobium sp. Root102 TaxID=1736422 RepID=UPI0006FAD316|nr:hypothetical protein [Mesorhizobium sp. Root102]KQU80514.1 hypothetical protein ASD12_32555 [Mesorhizobium sp. Root102]
MQINLNYATLEADVAAWIKTHLEDIRETLGEGEAYAAAVELEDNPWTALQWYCEDVRMGQRTNA